MVGKVMVGKIVAGLVGGLIVGLLASLVVWITSGSDPESGTTTAVVALFSFWGLSLVLALTASRAAKAWRRVLVACAIISFAMTPATFMAAATAGAAIGGKIMLRVGIIGFFLGAIFLVVGLLVGRDKQVIVVKEGSSDQT